jgi:hypothetical protein
MMYRCKLFRTSLTIGMLFTAVVVSVAQEAIAATPTPPVAPLILSGRQSARPAGTYSAGIADIIKMLDTKIAAQVISAYIQNSSIPYNPDAMELIALKEHGAPTEMLTALLHHGDELRLHLAQAHSTVNGADYDYAPEAPNPAYPYNYPDASYPAYPDNYYTYAVWPAVYWPLAYVGEYRPYWYGHGGSYRRNSYSQHLAEGTHGNWASAVRPAPQAPRWVSAPSSGHSSFAAAHSGGSHGFGHSGGRVGGRSR